MLALRVVILHQHRLAAPTWATNVGRCCDDLGRCDLDV